ncbi:uncharacterized protein N7484_007772 [Penicillium longicatenatum]|uniref:uncharacterized protein n=1 Tax=Penicillium longicatenatum TaxID=1561947 RepID=UPI002548592D|nr:uncharacterized protein N7484_007772 [Penicillium longicatenatum]KAJ5639910.1 hypothetical protein N7484_007772 [Penicillium longicatenatum]
MVSASEDLLHPLREDDIIDKGYVCQQPQNRNLSYKEKVSTGGEGHVSGLGTYRIFRYKIVVFRAFSTAERTGSPVLHTLWSYVLGKTLG